jgi:cellulose synthase/poly-beta-1,6-N-acetylglucosamine synthase-like glycosyltransferase
MTTTADIATISREGFIPAARTELVPRSKPIPDAAIVLGSHVERRHAHITCAIPAYNEQDTIAPVIQSLLDSTRPPDTIHVIINNTDDLTKDRADVFEGTHTRTVRGMEYYTQVYIYDIGVNPDKKIGALNAAYQLALAEGADYLLGVDGDTTVDPHAIEHLEAEIVDDSRIGGLSAIYTIDKKASKGPGAKFLIAGQRAQFGSFNLDNLLNGRNMAVLGGQCSIFSMNALAAVATREHQQMPWVRDSEVEDSLLSLQIKNAGYKTKISAKARAFVGPMTTLRALDAQQVKWNFGAIDLFFPGVRGNTTGQPFHPNLRIRWYENISMLFNICSRVAFLLLLAAALSVNAFVFNPIWLIPPGVAVLLNLRIALSMHDKSFSDIAYAALVIPAELYMWLRIGHFTRAWVQFFIRTEQDNWAAQAAAERGRGSKYIFPLVLFAIAAATLYFAWTQQTDTMQYAILSIGWPLLYLFTILQTAFMAKKLFRRHKGFTL